MHSGSAAREENRLVAQALFSKKPLLLFFKAEGCSLCRALQDHVADLEATKGVAVCSISTDDQASWAPEVTLCRSCRLGLLSALTCRPL
jgi:peroxiredoxin